MPWVFYAQARRYDSWNGRFVSEDLHKGYKSATYTLNQYSYCWNRPLDYVDNNGKFPWLVIIAVVGTGLLLTGCSDEERDLDSFSFNPDKENTLIIDMHGAPDSLGYKRDYNIHVDEHLSIQDIETYFSNANVNFDNIILISCNAGGTKGMNDELDESKLKDNVAALIAKLTGAYVFASDGYVYPPDYNYQNNKSGDKWLSSRILGVDDEKYDATWIIYKYTNENYTINILKCNAFSYPEMLEQINRMKCTIE